MRPGIRNLAINLGLIAGSVAIALVGAELVLRALAPGEAQNEGRLYRLEANPGLAQSTFLPGVEAVHKGIRVRTNAHGLRDVEYRREKPAGTYRVAVFGDSFTYGQGVPLPDVFTERLEARLRRTLGERVEVLNFGTPGMNSFQELLYYSNFGRSFEPDLVLAVWVPWDHALNGYRYADFERFVAEGVPPDREARRRGERVGDDATGSFYRDYVQSLFVVRFFGRRLKDTLGALGWNVNRYEELEHQNMDSEGYRLSFASLARLAESVEADGADFRLVIFPGLQRLDSDYYQDLVYSKIEAFAEEHGIRALNLFPTFRGRDPFELHVSLVDAHPNAKAHAIAADALFSDLFPTIEAALRR